MGTAVVRTANSVLGFTEKSFRTDKACVHFAEGPPTGPALVLLHGLTRDWRSFSVLLPELSRRFHVFALDLRGHGGSSHVAGSYRISECADDVIAFVHAVLPAGAAIFGHSLGAMIAVCVAASGNCQVNALIVGDTMITPDNFRHSLYTPLFQQLHELLLRHGSQDDLAAAMGKILIPLPGFDEPVRIEELPGNTPEVLADWAGCALQTDPKAIAMTVDGSAFEGWAPEVVLPRISCPTLLLQGNPELDALLSDDDVKFALRLLPNAQHLKFPLLGHALFMQQPRPVLNAVTSFLSRV
jgi:pimeloyl-ACP methyl ester carboxylesterase